MKQRFSKMLLLLCGIFVFAGIFFAMPQRAEAAHTHSLKTVTVKSATCTATGQSKTYCTKLGCSYSYTSTIPKTSHSYTQTYTVNSTCYSTGATYKQCSCGARVQTGTIAMKSHSLKTVTTKSATCTATGTYVTSCTNSGCHYSTTGTIPKTSHNYSQTYTVNSTCYSTGATYKQCSCGARVQTGTIAMKAHSLKTVTTKEATCTSTGTYVTSCTNSGCHYSTTGTIAKKAHNYTKTYTVNATCYSTGATYKQCSCGDRVQTGTIPMTAHSLKTSTTKEATCTEDGTYVTSCTNSGCHYSTTGKISKKGHNYTETYTVNATCYSTGATYKKCACGDRVQTGTLPMTSHTLKTSTTKEATCTEDGTYVTYCTNNGCHYSTTGIIQKKGHNYTKTYTVDATCYSTGATYKECACGDRQKTETIPVKPHILVTRTVKEATCTEDGSCETYCINNGCHYSTIGILRAYGHNFSDSYVVDSTCYQEGGVYRKCECGYIETVSKIPKKTHKLKTETAKKATCTEDGCYITSCINNGCHYSTTKTIPATGHTYDEKTLVCSGCYRTRCEIEGHKFAAGSLECSVCHTSRCEIEGHKYVDDVCTVCGYFRCIADGHTPVKIGYFYYCDVCGIQVCCNNPVFYTGEPYAFCDSECQECWMPLAEHTAEALQGAMVSGSERYTVYDSKEEILAQLGHYGEWHYASVGSCESPEQKDRVCTYCGYHQSVYKPATGHDYDENGFCRNESYFGQRYDRFVSDLSNDDYKKGFLWGALDGTTLGIPELIRKGFNYVPSDVYDMAAWSRGVEAGQAFSLVAQLFAQNPSSGGSGGNTSVELVTPEGFVVEVEVGAAGEASGTIAGVPILYSTASGGPSGGGSGSGKTLSDERVDDYVDLARNNPGSDTAILGETGKYDVMGDAKGYSYYKMSDTNWHNLEIETGYNWDEVWKPNQKYLDEIISAGKRILLTSDPSAGYYFPDGSLRYYQREINYLASKGFEFTPTSDGLWLAERVIK